MILQVRDGTVRALPAQLPLTRGIDGIHPPLCRRATPRQSQGLRWLTLTEKFEEGR